MEIYVLINEKPQGPYTPEDMQNYLQTGQFQGADLGAYAGSQDWKPLAVMAQSWDAAAPVAAARQAGVVPLAKKSRKTLFISMAIAALFIGAGVYFLPQIKFHRHYAPGEVAPIPIANDIFSPDGINNNICLIDVDEDTKRTPNSAPAIRIKCPVSPDTPGAAKYLAFTNDGPHGLDNSSSLHYDLTNGSPFLGQHIRLTCWLKTSNVKGWASAFMIVNYADTGYKAAWDDMSDRPIAGTTDWQQVEFITDIPDAPCAIYFGPDLYGTGALWGDDFQIAIASPNAPVTDDRKWRITTPERTENPNIYSETIDPLTQHGGHPAICLAYTPDGPAPRGTWMRWGKDIYAPNDYLGHTLRMSGWVKTENVSGQLEPNLRPCAGDNKVLAKAKRDSNLKGTRDWTQFAATCSIPKNTHYIDANFILNGSGKAWIDMDALKFQIIK